MKDASFLLAPFAHRGLHNNEIPENSLAAFRAAAERGFAIETDVRFSKDGRLVVFHDDTLARMTGEDRAVSDCTVSELKHLRLAGTDEQIPLVSELLRTVGGKVPLLIEIKNEAGVKPKRIARALFEALQGYGGEYAVQSFNPFYVRAYKKLAKDVPCGVLSAAKFTKEDLGGGAFWKIKAKMLGKLSLNFYVKPDFVSYEFHGLPTKQTDAFKGPVLAWTVRSAEDETAARAHAQNIIFEHFLPRY